MGWRPGSRQVSAPLPGHVHAWSPNPTLPPHPHPPTHMHAQHTNHAHGIVQGKGSRPLLRSSRLGLSPFNVQTRFREVPVHARGSIGRLLVSRPHAHVWPEPHPASFGPPAALLSHANLCCGAQGWCGGSCCDLHAARATHVCHLAQQGSKARSRRRPPPQMLHPAAGCQPLSNYLTDRAAAREQRSPERPGAEVPGARLAARPGGPTEDPAHRRGAWRRAPSQW